MMSWAAIGHYISSFTSIVTKPKDANQAWVERTPESEDERAGVINAINKDVEDMKSGKIETNTYSLSEFEEKFS
ncbi:hypothetical protein [Methanocella arvoryzae]|uniref:hypothetical protein n=1 Tax=Methanocella arvoryzae TaxID=1175445 RepID=UPI0011D191E2|nr:hypothetical protein [Methanocella arvoryzae]